MYVELVLDTLRVVVTDTPLSLTPRLALDIPQVIVGEFTDRAGFERQLPGTFGSRQWLWSEDDDLLFDKDSRELVCVGLHLPAESVPAEAGARLPAGPPALRGGLRAQEARDFGLSQTMALWCDAEATELTCLRDLAVLDTALDARIAIAPGLALLVQAGAVAGWSLTDPARYLTTGYAAPDPAPPSPATGLRLAECLALITRPLVDEVMDKEPDVWRRLRATEQALREQQDDRRRADVLHRVISRLIEDYEP